MRGGVELISKAAEQREEGKANKEEDNATSLQEMRISLQFKSVWRNMCSPNKNL